MSEAVFRELFAKARAVKAGGRDAFGVLSTGEQLAVALVLDRADWITECGYTLVDAIQRIGPVWLAELPYVAEALKEDHAPAAPAGPTTP